MLIITKDNVKNIIGTQDKFLLTNGKYEVYAINRCHIGESKTIYVSNNPAQISIVENTSKKRLDITITKSQDLAAGITNIFIYKKVDNDYMLLSQDDFSGTITNTRYTYSFATSGAYKVVVEDKFRSGLDAVTMDYSYTQPLPQANIYGVQENGYTNKDVNIQYADYVTCSLYKDNVYIKELSSREKITEEGTYLVLVQDLDGNEIVFNFIIDKTAPVITLEGVNAEGTTNRPVTVTWNEGLGYIVLGDTITRIDSGITLDEDNNYYVVVEDEAGNISQLGFKIDTHVSYKINVLNGAISNEDVIVHSSEDVEIEMKYNGALMEYAPEQSVTEEGEYTLTIRDSFGNEETMNFRIIKHTQKSFNYTPGDGVTIDNVLSSGEAVEHGDTLNLTTDGEYSITIWDGEVYYTFNICIDTTAPEVILEGVENGGTTKNKVKISSVSEECTILAKRDGVEFKYNVGDTLEELGNYEFTFVDSVGNSTNITFSIVYSLNGAAIALIVISCLVLVSGAVLFLVYRFKRIGKKKKKEDIETLQKEDKEIEEIELD